MSGFLYNLPSPQFSHGRLPGGYTELTYIESTGTQYIDTMIKTDAATEYTLSWDGFVPGPANTVLFGSKDSTTADIRVFLLFWYISWTKYCIQHSGGTVVEMGSVAISGSHNAILSMQNSEIDGTTRTIGVSYACNYNAYLFGYNAGGNALGLSSYKLKSFTAKKSNVLVRDFIPCYRKSDGEVGLYDLVSGAFFGNAGTGSFIAGEEV